MSLESLQKYPLPPVPKDSLFAKKNGYIDRGLTEAEAADLIVIENVERQHSQFLTLSEGEKERKRIYLEKMDKK